MKIDRNKLEMAMAHSVMDANDIMKAATMPRGTWLRVSCGHNVKPKTAGKIARALGVPVESLLADEDEE